MGKMRLLIVELKRAVEEELVLWSFELSCWNYLPRIPWCWDYRQHPEIFFRVLCLNRAHVVVYLVRLR